MDDVILLSTRICGFTTHWSWDHELYAYRVFRIGNPGSPQRGRKLIVNSCEKSSEPPERTKINMRRDTPVHAEMLQNAPQKLRVAFNPTDSPWLRRHRSCGDGPMVNQDASQNFTRLRLSATSACNHWLAAPFSQDAPTRGQLVHPHRSRWYAS
jgi:hypothetical protein